MKADQENWDNEGGHMSSTGRVVSTPRCEMAYKVVRTHDAGASTEYTFRRSPFNRPVAAILTFFVVGGALALAIS